MKCLFLNSGLSCVLVLGLFGCAMPEPYVPEATAENMTSEGLVRVENSRFDEVYVRPGFDLARFDSVVLAPVSISYKSRRPENELSDRQFDLMKRYFSEELEAAFVESGKFTVVDTAAAGTMRVHAGIVDLEAKFPDQSLPIRRNVVFVGSSGEMTLIAEIYDGQSLELLARIRDRRQARQQWHRATYVSEWGEVRSAFHYWAGIARDRIVAASESRM